MYRILSLEEDWRSGLVRSWLLRVRFEVVDAVRVFV
jgi:hypothetical protein